jgi:hypothetical protein
VRDRPRRPDREHERDLRQPRLQRLGARRVVDEPDAELLAFAMELVAERVGERVRALREQGATAAQLLEQVLPLDDERLAEAQVWLAFTTRALVDPRLKDLRDSAHTALRGLCREAAALTGAVDPELEGERLHALVDGLALHALLDPATTTPARQRTLLAEALG